MLIWGDKTTMYKTRQWLLLRLLTVLFATIVLVSMYCWSLEEKQQAFDCLY